MKTHEHKFPLGMVVMTRGCLEFCAANDVNAFAFIARHARGDWGELGDEDKAANERALVEGTRLLSCYKEAGEKFYVITEWDRSVTTLLLADEY